MNTGVLTPQEALIFRLRELFETAGYKRFKMGKFEDYDLYSRYKDFLVSDAVISFTDGSGALKALKPDVTLSIIKSARPQPGKTEKLYYNESVYRQSGSSFKEMMQCGLECIGSVDETCVLDVLSLAAKCLKEISEDCILSISQVVSGDETGSEKLSMLQKEMDSLGFSDIVRIDSSSEPAMRYYSGIVFKGYINGVPEAVLSGGQYDMLAVRMGKNCRAIGFAVYMDALERFLNSDKSSSTHDSNSMLKVALPKGRLGEKVYKMFEAAGYECPEVLSKSRKLIFENAEKRVSYFWVKPSDVAAYVERGAADVGVCGKDIIMEHDPDIYELLDLNTGKCRMAVASKKDFSDDESRTLTVATKFENIAAEYYASLGRDIDIVPLNGSIELAPLLGLSDVIVDIVETGNTLRENGLMEYEKIADISARLIANKASFEFKNDMMLKLSEALGKQVEND